MIALFCWFCFVTLYLIAILLTPHSQQNFAVGTGYRFPHSWQNLDTLVPAPRPREIYIHDQFLHLTKQNKKRCIHFSHISFSEIIHILRSECID